MNRYSQCWFGSRGIVVLLLGVIMAVGACAGSSTQLPVAHEPTLTTKEVLQTCAVVPDEQMAEIRGCYDSKYIFGLDLIANIDLTNRSLGVSAQFKVDFENSAASAAADDQAVKVTFNNGLASFDDGQVAYRAGIANGSLGSGIMHVVMVAGNNNLIISNTNVLININNLQTTSPVKALGLGNALINLGMR